jgi:holo-[acyl-carrier protein] synthase
MFRLGTDIVYIPRIEAAIARFGDRFLQRVYTPAEQVDCRCNLPTLAAINKLAGRWAAKEAVVKALGTGWGGVGYTDVEICRLPSGAPSVQLHGRAMALVGDRKVQWQLSLSHDRDYAIASVLLVDIDTNP